MPGWVLQRPAGLQLPVVVVNGVWSSNQNTGNWDRGGSGTDADSVLAADGDGSYWDLYPTTPGTDFPVIRVTFPATAIDTSGGDGSDTLNVSFRMQVRASRSLTAATVLATSDSTFSSSLSTFTVGSSSWTIIDVPLSPAAPASKLRSGYYFADLAYWDSGAVAHLYVSWLALRATPVP